jgi:hypothetical protein
MCGKCIGHFNVQLKNNFSLTLPVALFDTGCKSTAYHPHPADLRKFKDPIKRFG